MDKHEWSKLGIAVFVWLCTAFFCYQWGKNDCAAKHKIVLKTATQNIIDYEKNMRKILTESDADALKRALATYDSTKR